MKTKKKFSNRLTETQMKTLEKHHGRRFIEDEYLGQLSDFVAILVHLCVIGRKKQSENIKL